MNMIASRPATAQTQTAPRPNLYAGIHKGLRRALADAASRLGAADFGAVDQAAAAIAETRGALVLMRLHAEKENEHIHAALDVRAPGAAAAFDREHAGHAAEIDALENLLDTLSTAEAGFRPALGRRLHDAFIRFAGDSLVHMAAEEDELMPRLWGLFTDAELAAIQGRIIGSLAPDELLAFLEPMLPALSPAERAGLLGGMQRGLPAERFAGVLALARRVLARADFAALATTLGETVAPATAPVLLVVEFPFAGPWGDELTEACRDLAGAINAAPGLRWKIWGEDRPRSVASGIYLFDDADAARAYLDVHVPRLKGFGVTEVRVQSFAVHQDLSRMNRGPVDGTGR